jgi:hypothetical protein
MKKIVACILFLLTGLSAVHAEDGGKAFLERFYQEGAECWFDNAFLKKHLTQNALKYLHDAYPYDDEAGDGLAMWLFYQEGGWDLGEFKEIKVDRLRENTYRVTCRSRFNEDTYEYTVVFGLVKVGNAWKIDTMKPGKGDLVVSDSAIQDGSRWNIASLDYTAKVNADKTITFNAMAEGEELAFRLTPDSNKEDEYVLTDDPHDESYNPYSTPARVKYIKNDGWKLLCIYDKKGLLQDILDGSQYAEGPIVAQSKWTAQIQGKYITHNNEPVEIGWNKITIGAIDLSYEHVTFNDMITGVIKIDGGTRFQGMWEAVVTLDGITLYKVEQDEFGSFKRLGDKEKLIWNRSDRPRFNYACMVLLNDKQFRKMKKSTLRIMRNEILAVHGYRFQSEDLQHYFSTKEWYQPVESNSTVKPYLLDQLNIELIKAEEAKPDEDRYVTEE